MGKYAKAMDLKTYENTMQEDLEKFFKVCWEDLGWEYDPQHWRSYISDIEQKYMSNGCFWCLYDDKELIGTVAVWTIDEANKVAEMKRLYVLKNYQGQGYGELLFTTALNYAKSNGYRKVRADTDKDRRASQYLMRKHKFQEIGRYNDNPHAELFFELVLLKQTQAT